MTIFDVQSLGYLYRRKDSYEHNRIDRSFGTGQILTKEEWITLVESASEENREYAAHKARALADRYYGKEIYVRGLIEFTNYCKMTAIIVVFDAATKGESLSFI